MAGAVGIVHAGASISVEQTPAASLCAEQIALADFCAAGEKAIARLVVIGPPPRGAPAPCGRCLQVLREFGEGVEIRWGTATREYGRSSLTRLLPHAFGDYRTARARRRG